MQRRQRWTNHSRRSRRRQPPQQRMRKTRLAPAPKTATPTKAGASAGRGDACARWAVAGLPARSPWTLFHGLPVYDLTPETGLRDVDLQGWSPDASVYELLLEEVQAVTVIEVGVWKGLSAVHMAEWLKNRQNGVLVAIDTWLGAPEFWDEAQITGMDAERDMYMEHGFPTVYRSFLSNMIHRGLQDVVVPLPQTSKLAHTVMHRLGVTQVDLIHIDAAHGD